jgi:hypothetical protein
MFCRDLVLAAALFDHALAELHGDNSASSVMMPLTVCLL